MWILLFIIPLCLLLALSNTRPHTVINHNGSMREFHYRIEMTLDEIWKLMECPNASDILKYRLDRGHSTVTFFSDLPDGSLPITYQMHFEPSKNQTVLKIVQADHLLEKNRFAARQNAFWEMKLNAVPIPFELQNQIS